MPAGIQVLTSGGDVQVDSEYFNFALKIKGTNGDTSSNTYDFTGTRPMIAVRPVEGTTACLYSLREVTPGNWRAIFRGFNYTFFVFDVPGSSSASSGFQVFRSDGSLAFCSSMNYMRPVAIAESGTVGAIIATETSGRQWAAVPWQWGIGSENRDEVDPIRIEFWIKAPRLNSGGVWTLGEQTLGTGRSAATFTVPSNTKVTFVDVTNY